MLTRRHPPGSTTGVGQPEQQPRHRLSQEAALEELERFGRDIQRYREQRQALGEEFETFVRGFKVPPDAARPAAHASVPLPPREPAPTLTPAETQIFETPATELSPPAMTAPPTAAKTPVAAIAAGAAILVGGGLLAAFLWNRSPDAAPEPTATPDPAAAAPAPAPAAQPAPAPVQAAPAPPSTGSEIVAERQVWMRVIVDGEKVLEREVPAGTKIPLNAEKTIVIRTGNAGAVRLSIRGGPATLIGREAEVVTRSFTVPPRSDAVR